ncbi:hypothetical protein PV10_00582 [Exophiala mesophila]|uniref:Rhodopsin domain-containing protein n=1 Tax=Exophiala mesophila TaxID=212818 RepID=A0A0D1Y7M8_EXOME|nr:uncharacterized protein PV10_00582 [Exophiala mesophila]KIV96761.1 hypothetical protein PV10_00582 [Exophiala mesophila]
MSNYRGSALEVLTVAFAGVSLVIVALRAVARHRIAQVFEATDILLPISLVFLLAQSALVRIALLDGLGRHTEDLTDDQISLFQKLIYGSNLAFQLVLSLDQVVILLLIKSVEPQLPVRIGCNVLFGFIVLYSIAALAIQGFQCALPEPWNVTADRCINRQAFFTGFISANILVDILTLILPILMVCKLKTSRDKKIFVCILFGARISVPVVTVFQTLHLHSVLGSEDLTWDIVPYQTWVQVIMNLSLITACLPSLGRMMWELWAFGSGLRTSAVDKTSESKDFGHELGLPQGQSWFAEKKEASVTIREVRSFDSTSTVDEEQKTQKTLPALPRRTTSRFRPVRKQDHHYRRPASLSRDKRFLPAMEFSALDMPSPTVMIQRHKYEEEVNSRRQFPFPPHPSSNKPSPLAASLPPGRLEEPLPVYTHSAPVREPTLPQVADTYHEADMSSIDIDSYYMMNNVPPHDPGRTEMVLQHMIDELKSQNSSFYSRVQSSVYSVPRMQSSVYSISRTQSPLHPTVRTQSPLHATVRTQSPLYPGKSEGGWI